MKTNNKNGKGKMTAVKPAKDAKQKPETIMEMRLSHAVFCAQTLCDVLARAQAKATEENGLLAMVLTGRLETAAGLHRKLTQIRNCMS